MFIIKYIRAINSTYNNCNISVVSETRSHDDGSSSSSCSYSFWTDAPARKCLANCLTKKTSAKTTTEGPCRRLAGFLCIQDNFRITFHLITFGVCEHSNTAEARPGVSDLRFRWLAAPPVHRKLSFRRRRNARRFPLGSQRYLLGTSSRKWFGKVFRFFYGQWKLLWKKNIYIYLYMYHVV